MPLQAIYRSFSRGFLPLAFFLLAAFWKLPAQFPIAEHFGRAEGLPSSTIYRIVQDQDGRIWLGTANGLCRTDAYAFEHFGPRQGLPGSEVVQLTMDRDGQVWVGTFGGGLAHWNGAAFVDHRKESWIPKLGAVPRALDLLPDGKLLVATDDSAWTFEPGGKHAQALTYRLGRMYFQAKGGKRLQLIDRSDPPAHFFPDTALPPAWWAFEGQAATKVIPSDLPEKIAPHARIWIQSWDQLMEHTQGATVNAVVADDRGQLWVGTQGKGLWVLVPGQDAPLCAIPDLNINALLCDRNGNVWAGSNRQGLYLFRKVDRGHFLYPTGTERSPEGITALALGQDHGLLLGQFDGHVKVWDVSGERRTIPSPVQSGQTVLGIADLGALGLAWYGPKGLQVWRGGRFSSYLQEASVKAMCQSGNGTWYAGTSEGLFQIQAAGGALQFERSFSKRITTLLPAPDSESLYLATLDSLLLWSADGVRAAFPLHVLGGRLTCWVHDSFGGLWLGTNSNGLFRWENGSWDHFTAADGLSSDNCRHLTTDAKGRIWLGTDQGWGHFSYMGGNAWRYARQSRGSKLEVRGLVAQGDSIWIAHQQGLSLFVSVPSPQSQIRLQAAGVTVNGADSSVKAHYRLPHWQNSISLSFFDPSFSADEFQIRCAKIDSAWLALDRPEFTFPFLAAGQQYDIEFRGRSRGGIWGPATSISFDIRQAFFQSSWFFLLLGLAGAAALALPFFLLLRHRIHRIQTQKQFEQSLSKQKLSALKARMNPHFIFNSMNAIQHLILDGKERTALDFVSNLSRLMRTILQSSGEEWISLDTEISLCQCYLEVESVRLDEGFSFELEVADGLRKSPYIVPAMIVQPFLENAIWHGLIPKSEDRRLQLNIEEQGEGIAISVRDNGIGRLAAGKRTAADQSKGIRSTQLLEERLALLNRSFPNNPIAYQIQDLLDAVGQASGTQVHLYLPKVIPQDLHPQMT